MKATHVSPPDVEVRHGARGSIYVRDRRPLGPYAAHITERLDHWAQEAPDRPFLVERDHDDEWRAVSYAEARDGVRRLAQALLDRGLSADRRLLILSGNSIDHALLALAAMYVGVLYAPVSPAYSLQSRDYSVLSRIVAAMQPAVVFAADGVAYEEALQRVIRPGIEIVTSGRAPRAIIATPYERLLSSPPREAVDRAHGSVGPDTIAKILFTSGSTGQPKGVINTQRMLCSNQAMLQSVFGFLTDEPPVLCDWLPWNHTAGGNHNFGIALYNGGTFYLDGGRPTAEGIETTVRNLREIAATAHFTVPRTYEALLPYLRRDRTFRERFFSRLQIFFYAAAGLGQRHMDDLQALSRETTGDELLWVTGLGATETAPFAMCTGSVGAYAGFVGFPVPGVELKIAPVEHKLEARVRGPNVTPGYWHDEGASAAARDDEGYYRMGDALRPVAPGDPSKGFMFDGRLADDFKLSSGTWVGVGALRARLLIRLSPYVQDVVLAAPDREFLAALVFPQIAACRTLCPDLPADTAPGVVLADPRVRDTFARLLEDLARESTGTSTCVVRAMVVERPPSIDAREVTDKGSLNQKVILQNRADLVDELYLEAPTARTIVVSRQSG